MSINDSVPVHNDWAAAYYIIISLYFANSFLKQVQEVSVALGLHFFIGDEAQGRAVDAVAHAVGRLRVAGEHMAEMGVSGAASDLRAAHPVAQVLQFHHGRLFNGLCESRSAAVPRLKEAAILSDTWCIPPF